MCSDQPIRELADYKSITVLTQCAGPTVIMAPTYRDLIKEVQLFLNNGLNVRNKTSLINKMQADYGIIKQIAEKG